MLKNETYLKGRNIIEVLPIRSFILEVLSKSDKRLIRINRKYKQIERSVVISIDNNAFM